MGASDDQVLLKLVIKGMDPSEVQQLAASTQGELNSKIDGYLQKLIGLHKAANETTTAEAKKATQAQIDGVEKQIDAASRLAVAHEKAAEKAAKAHEKAAEESKLSWRSMLESVEGMATGFKAALGVAFVAEAISKFKEVGEEIARDTQIYKGLHGSIDAMRESTRGEVADIDLVSAKNRGFQKELNLTDEQYGQVAAAAKQYANVTGTDVKESIDKLIDGLATGKVKMLQHVGVMVDAKAAAEDYARAHGTIVDKLSDEEKILATQQAAMAKITEKTHEFGTEALTVATAIEKAFASMKNAIVDAAVAIGNIKLTVPNDYSQLAKLRQQGGLDDEGRPIDDARSRLIESGALGPQALNARRRAIRLQAEQGEDMRKRAEDDIAKYGSDYGEGSESSSVTVYNSEKKEKAKSEGYFPFGKENSFGSETYGAKVAGETEREYQARGADNGNYPDQEKFEGGFKERNDKDFEEMAKKRAAGLKDVVDKAGGSFYARLLFGPNGPDELYKDMDAFQRAGVDSMGQVAKAAEKMGEALGATLAAAISGGKGAKKSMRDTTEAILQGLAAQALTQAIFETAMGLAAAAMGNPAAAMHFAAAATFGAVGVTAGVAARMVGTDSSGTSAASSSGGTSSSGGAFNSPRSSSSDTGQSMQPLTINLSVWPGGEAEAGRQVAKALGAYTRESGVSINDVTTGKVAA